MITSPDSFQEHTKIETPKSDYDRNIPLFCITAHQFGGFALITHHGFDANDKIKPGRIIDAATAIEALDSVITNDSEAANGWVSNRVIFNTHKVLAWSCKKHKRTTWFRQLDGMKSIEIPYPTLIFVLNRKARTLYVFASLKSTVDANTKLYHAPVMNVYNTGALCQGSAPLPSELNGSNESLLTECEDTLLATAFTHVNHHQTFKHERSGKTVSNEKHIAIWERLAKSGRSPKKSNLVPLGRTLSDVISYIGGLK